ncbi:hypothetical protein Pint_24636 [Pistacia integerrima]|uniref:Uncharacterized protein n=1 Tax=Pistacia integerrima TaxID=434235 RepID=A0ACC0YDF3_9ROSI|nr:hypothetical protein Pint_24636 [Pistacia integerrima]
MLKPKKIFIQLTMENSDLPLHLCNVNKFSIIFNRLHALVHTIAITFLIYYRVSFLFLETGAIPLLPGVLVFASELLLSVIWLIGRGYIWHPVSRTVFPERLPADDKLPAIDVFICTADSVREPTLGVMNTVLSAMALDYPPEKLHVYLSDDGGSPVTLYGMREAHKFAKWWLPFCRKFGIKTRCPQAYFSAPESDDNNSDHIEFMAEKKILKEKYEMFEETVMRAGEDGEFGDSRDHPTDIEIIEDISGETMPEDHVNMPLLVYVSREKRPDHLHHFKAGALNVLLRVSGVISNSPYILGLDCDMYCNDPTSARQAMCFHLDPKISSTLAYVQFPQKFYNISRHDIYDSQFRSAYKTMWHGMDGLRGPVLSGTGYYIKRESFYGNCTQKGIGFEELRNSLGSSNVFIKSLQENYKHDNVNDGKLSNALLQETKVVGFLYPTVAEDFFTGYILHCKGWKSTFLSPPRPQFLGTSATNLNDLLVQGTRWGTGLIDVAICRFSPLFYGPLRMSFLQSMCYAELSLFPLFYCFPLWCFATIPQLYLLHGIPIYPEFSSSFFKIFSFIFMSAIAKHLQEVLATGGSIETWRNEQRIWMIKSVTCHTYGSLDAILKLLGLRKASFVPSNKVMDNEQVKRYEMGQLDFQTSAMFLIPMATLMILNIAALFGGVARIIAVGNWDKMFVQVVLSFYIFIINFAIVEGMLIRKDKGRIPPSITVISVLFFIVFLFLGSVILLY